MELRANDKKNLEINVGKDIYCRYAIKTHFIKLKEDYIDIINKYVKPIYEEGDYIENSEEIAELLPSCDGFFFGGTAYDEYYLNDVKDTIEILKKVLRETDFEKEVVFYHASW